MSGHVFHPGHEELHGVTVVVGDRAGRTFVGRYHEHSERGVVLHDVAVHDPARDSLALEAWLDRQRKFGIQVAHRSLVIPSDSVNEVVRLTLR
jgi:hypothetical protein